MFISEKENNSVKMIIPSIGVSLQIITIRYFLKIMQLYLKYIKMI